MGGDPSLAAESRMWVPETRSAQARFSTAPIALGLKRLSIVECGAFWSNEDRASGMRCQSVRDAAKQRAT